MNIGRIKVQPELLMDWLQFQGGIVQGAGIDDRGMLCFDIEHPEMPEVKEGGTVSVVTPVYEQIETFSHIYETKRKPLAGIL